MTATTRTRARRTRYIVAAAVCGAAIVVIVVLGVVLSNNVVYFRTVSEAVSERDATGDDRFRMAGEVVPGSITETADGVQFQLTEGGDRVTIEHVGDPPDLFEDGAPVVCEGRWADGLNFSSDRILIKHDNEYRPPDAENDGGEGNTG
ncbi:MAG: cytochrome c maturation protein CcmE [Candidatus Rokuibacteriota bacterium]